MALTRSKPASIFTPEGNSLAVFIDVADGTLKLKDVFGDVELFSDFISGGGGGLNLKDDVVISATLTEVVDKNNTPSILSISTSSVGIGTTTPTKVLNVNGDAFVNGLTIGRGIGNIATNTALGKQALNANTSGEVNVAVGQSALLSNTSGSSNTAIGVSALQNNTQGNFNSAFGLDSLVDNTSGQGNTALGIEALRKNATTSHNVAVGMTALYNNTASNNVGVGFEASYTNTNSTGITAIGYQSLKFNTGGNNTALGAETSSGNFNGSLILGVGATATASNQCVFGSIGNNAGAVSSTSDVPCAFLWAVKINGTDYQILMV